MYAVSIINVEDIGRTWGSSMKLHQLILFHAEEDMKMLKWKKMWHWKTSTVMKTQVKYDNQDVLEEIEYLVKQTPFYIC